MKTNSSAKGLLISLLFFAGFSTSLFLNWNTLFSDAQIEVGQVAHAGRGSRFLREILESVIPDVAGEVTAAGLGFALDQSRNQERNENPLQYLGNLCNANGVSYLYGYDGNWYWNGQTVRAPSRYVCAYGLYVDAAGSYWYRRR